MRGLLHYPALFLLLCDVLRLFLCAGDALFGTIHYGETIV